LADARHLPHGRHQAGTATSSPTKSGTTSNRQTGHIWFNLELAKKHPLCLEYIVVHEMTHLLERNHGERYAKLMDAFMPDWRARRDQLNAAPLAAEDWGSQSGGGGWPQR